MSASDSKVVVNHESDLSSTKKPIFLLGFFSSRLTFFLKWEFWMILFKEDAIFASSISSGHEYNPELGAMILSRSPTRPSPLLWSMTLPPRENRNKNLPGFLNLLFQHENVEGVGNCQIEPPISAVFAVQPQNSVGMILLLERKNSWSMVSLQFSALVVSRFRSSPLRVPRFGHTRARCPIWRQSKHWPGWIRVPCAGPPFAAPVDVTLDLAGDGRRESRGGFPFPSLRQRPLLVWLFMQVLAPFPAPVCRDPLGVFVWKPSTAPTPTTGK